jgi:hypothetical protein
MDEMIFDDVTLIQIPVRIGSERFILREADEETAIKYRSMILKAARVSDGGKFSLGTDGLALLEPMTVGLCLFKEPYRDGDQSVGESFVRKLKPKTVSALFDKIKEISHLGETENREGLEKQAALIQARIAEMDQAKNLPGAMTVISA